MAAICQSPMLDSLLERIQLRGGGWIDVLMILAFQLARHYEQTQHTKRYTTNGIEWVKELRHNIHPIYNIHHKGQKKNGD